jgi:hypothetical protein
VQFQFLVFGCLVFELVLRSSILFPFVPGVFELIRIPKFSRKRLFSTYFSTYFFTYFSTWGTDWSSLADRLVLPPGPIGPPLRTSWSPGPIGPPLGVLVLLCGNHPGHAFGGCGDQSHLFQLGHCAPYGSAVHPKHIGQLLVGTVRLHALLLPRPRVAPNGDLKAT